jgi:hypothetical protein
VGEKFQKGKKTRWGARRKKVPKQKNDIKAEKAKENKINLLATLGNTSSKKTSH